MYTLPSLIASILSLSSLISLIVFNRCAGKEMLKPSLLMKQPSPYEDLKEYTPLTRYFPLLLNNSSNVLNSEKRSVSLKISSPLLNFEIALFSYLLLFFIITKAIVILFYFFMMNKQHFLLS